jgi:hypothetical protein
MLFMKKALFDLKTIFQQKLNEDQKEREDLVKSRIMSFNSRHKNSALNDDRILHSEPRIRPLWE